MDLSNPLTLLATVAVALFVQHLIIQGAVKSALRMHYEWVEARNSENSKDPL